MKILTEGEQLAWAAGFLDGEGTFGTYHDTTKPTSPPRYRIQASQVHRDPLDRLAATLGGTVRGPYGPYSGNRQPFYSWQLHAQAGIEATRRLLPYLSAQKTAQATAAMETTCVS